MYDITTEKLDEEKASMRRQDSLELIECIRKSIELLISLKMDEDQTNGNQNKSMSSIKMHMLAGGREREGKGELNGISLSSKLMLDKDDGRGYTHILDEIDSQKSRVSTT